MTPSIQSWIYLSLVYIGLAVVWSVLCCGIVFVLDKIGEREEGRGMSQDPKVWFEFILACLIGAICFGVIWGFIWILFRMVEEDK